MSDQTKPLTRMAILQDMAQRYKDYNDKLNKLIADTQELKRVLSHVDTDAQLKELHQQIITQYPVKLGQYYQVINEDGEVLRYTARPSEGRRMWRGSFETSICHVDLNGINWKDTLIKL